MSTQYVEDNSTANAGAGGPDLSGLGLAVACLVLGIISIPFSLVLLGGMCGLIGLVLGIVHLRRKYIFRTMVWWGFSLSLIGLLASAVVGIFYVHQVREMRKIMSGELESQSYEKWIGAAAPDLTVKDIAGNTITLSSLKGRRVILDLWATWCPPCKMEIPHFVKLRDMYDSNDLVIIGISREDERTVASFGDKNRINYLLVAEKNLPSPYTDVVSIPTTFFIDRKGIIRNVATGYQDFESLNSFVAALDSNKEPNQPENPTAER